VSQLASQATQVGSATAALTITAGVNDSFVVDVDGESAWSRLRRHVCQRRRPCREVQSKINGAAAISARVGRSQ